MRKHPRRADFRVHALKLVAQPLALSPEAGEHILSVRHDGFRLNLLVARDALQYREDIVIGRGDGPLVDQAHLLRLVQERLRSREAGVVDRFGIPKLAFELAKLAAGLIELRLLQEAVLVDGAEEIRQCVLDCLTDEVLALPVKQTLLAVDVVLVLKGEE